MPNVYAAAMCARRGQLEGLECVHQFVAESMTVSDCDAGPAAAGQSIVSVVLTCDHRASAAGKHLVAASH